MVGMRIDVISIFPDYLSPLHLSIVGRAIADGIVDLHIHNLRDYTHDRHRTVDDTPFGGGPGMVMKPEPWGEALDDVLAQGAATATGEPTLVIPTPSAVVFDQPLAAELSTTDWLVFACGRYEGIDSRVAMHYRDRIKVLEVSIGDYVLAGGEAAVLVMAEAVIRLLPGVLGNQQSAEDDSFAPNRDGGPLEGPVFTKPPTWRGHEVPEVLRSGNHGAIAKWRASESQARSLALRPELVSDAEQ